MKAIMASAVVIALCLAAVGGVTYSWFSDTEQSNITVNTGMIDIDSTWSPFEINSYGNEIPTPINGDGSFTFPHSSGIFDIRTIENKDGVFKTISMKNVVPGDSVSFSVSDITLKNTTNVAFEFGYSISKVSTGEDEPDTPPFVITNTPIPQEGSNNWFNTDVHNVQGSNAVTTITGQKIKIEIPIEYGNEYMGTSWSISIFISAVQSNAPGATTSHAIMTGLNTINVSPISGTTGTTTITFDNTEPTFTGNMTVTSFKGSDTGTFNITTGDGNAILGGISVDTGAEFTGKPVTISFEVEGDLTEENVTIYHTSNGPTTTTTTLSTTVTKTYNSTTRTTTISFTTTEGFSSYSLGINADVLTNAGYSTFSNAMASDVTDITLLKNVTVSNATDIEILSTESINSIDLNGFVLDFGSNRMEIHKSLSITGPGTVTSSHGSCVIKVFGPSENDKTPVTVSINDAVTIKHNNNHPCSVLLLNTGNTQKEGKNDYSTYNTTVNINDCVIDGIFTNGITKNTSETSTFNITNTTIVSQCYLPGYVNYNFNQCTFTTDKTAVILKSGTLTMNNCAISVNGEKPFTPDFVACTNGGFESLSCVNIEDNANYAAIGIVSIQNTTFNHNDECTDILYSKLIDRNTTINSDISVTTITTETLNDFEAFISVTMKKSNSSYPCTFYFKDKKIAEAYTAEKCAEEFEMTVTSFGEVQYPSSS